MASKSQSRRATPAAANRGVQARPGDATGMENERLRRENAAAITEASTGMSMVNPPPVVEETDTVVDYTQGGSPHVGGAEDGARLISMDEATADGTPVSHYDVPDSQVDMDSLPDGKTDVLPEIVANEQEPQPAHGERRDSQQQVRRQGEPPAVVEQREAPKVEVAHRVLRVNTDLEDITIGKDNHFTFRVGQPYKVPANVYEHLEEKGYVLR